MTDKKYSKVPGFRSEKKWKMIVASLSYLIFAIILFQTDGVTSKDIAIKRAQLIWLPGWLYIIVFYLKDIRKRIPFFNNRHKIVFYIVIILVFLTSTSMFIETTDRLKSPAQIQLEEAEENLSIASNMDRKIEKLGPVEDIEISDEEKLKKIRSEYDLLSSKQKALVTMQGHLEMAEARLSEVTILAAKEVELEEAQRRQEEQEAENKSKKEEVEQPKKQNMNQEITLLIEKGISEQDAITIHDKINTLGVPLWTSDSTILIEDQNADNDYILSYTTKDWRVPITLALHMLNGKVDSIIDQNLELIFDSHGLNSEYIFHKEIDYEGLQGNTKEIINSILKAPSTAKYAGGFLDPFEGWKIDKKETIIQIASYVDSQNSFGAMLRSDFLVQYKHESGTLKPVYIVFDNEVVVDNR